MSGSIDGVIVKLVEDAVEMEAAKAVRFRVFVDEQGVPAEVEVDEADPDAIHALALRNGLAVGTGRLLQMPSGEAKIGRMAVDQPHRGMGIGSEIIRWLEEEARCLGLQRAALHAQVYVKDFYAHLEYVEQGEIFMEAGIEHVLMQKRL